MAQSKPYSFLPLASDSGPGLTGFALAAASGGILFSWAGAFAGGWSCCAHDANTKQNDASRTSVVFFTTSFFQKLFFNPHLRFGNTVERIKILHDTGTCTRRLQPRNLRS